MRVGLTTMATFVTLIEIQPEHAAEGMQNIEERYEDATQLVEAHGGEVKGVYYGNIAGYDALVISEFPDRESFEKADILYSMEPSVEADAVQVHPYDEYVDLIDEALGE